MAAEVLPAGPLRLETLTRQLALAGQSESHRFHDLMARRVRTILMVSTPYEAFSLAWDGSLAEDIYGTYSLLHLQNVPQITTVTSGREALARLRQDAFDLVLVSSNLADMGLAEFGEAVKAAAPGLPVVALMFALGGALPARRAAVSPAVDYVFHWQGSAKVLLSIIKLVEDKLNTDRDLELVRIGIILVIEDSPPQYSFFLPHLYSLLMRQAFARVPFGIDENERQLHTRTRPKIVLARTLAEADDALARYQPFLHGVISDLQVEGEGNRGRRRGAAFLRRLRAAAPGVPVLLLSADETAPAVARALGLRCAAKNSPRVVRQLEEFCMQDLGFGDFVFRDGRGRELERVRSLRAFETALARAPATSIQYHSRRNQFSHWLLAQGESALAAMIRPLQARDFGSATELRRALVTLVSRVRRAKHRATIADFRADDFEPEYAFLITGRGSLGGKARGLAFMFRWLQQHPLPAFAGGVAVRFPPTLVITSDAFNAFMAANGLDRFAGGTHSDAALRRRFLGAALPAALLAQLQAYIRQVRVPLAVRSSSHLEDSSNQPFAGLYQTCMLPNSHPNAAVRLDQLARAVKLVYASAYRSEVQRYFQTLRLNRPEEKMAVIVQELVGRRHGDVFYPAFSGVAQSFNFYPFAPAAAHDGVASVALGFGKMVVEGGEALRFCPRFPTVLPQAATPADLRQVSQKRFYALPLDGPPPRLDFGKGSDLALFPLDRAERDQTLAPVGSVITGDDLVDDDPFAAGQRVVSFGPILRHRLLPLADMLQALLRLGRDSLGTDVEIEFAGNVDLEPGSRPEFALLQIRPMIATRGGAAIPRADLPPLDTALCASRTIMGHGATDGIRDLLYCHPRRFDFARSRQAAAAIGRLNLTLLQAGRRYVLIGPGRWGTRLPSLGIPVSWQDVAGAAAIVETAAPGKRIDLSQGAHFLHNLAATGIAYFTILRDDAETFVRWDRLEALPAAFDDGLVRHVRLATPLAVTLDAFRHVGIIAPACNTNPSDGA